MVCQTIQSLSIGPYTIESGTICVDGTTSGTASFTLKVGPFTYSKTIPWGTVNPQQTLGTSAGRVYLVGTNPLSSLFVDDVLTITEYSQKVATYLGYPGSFSIVNVGLTNTSGCNDCVVYVDYVASSPPLAVALVIALVISVRDRDRVGCVFHLCGDRELSALTSHAPSFRLFANAIPTVLPGLQSVPSGETNGISHRGDIWDFHSHSGARDSHFSLPSV